MITGKNIMIKGVDDHFSKKDDDIISGTAGTQLALEAFTVADVTKVILLEGIDGVSKVQIVGQALFEDFALRLGDLNQIASYHSKGLELFCLIRCHPVRSLTIFLDIIDKHMGKYKRFPQRLNPQRWDILNF